MKRFYEFMSRGARSCTPPKPKSPESANGDTRDIETLKEKLLPDMVQLPPSLFLDGGDSRRNSHVSFHESDSRMGSKESSRRAPRPSRDLSRGRIRTESGEGRFLKDVGPGGYWGNSYRSKSPHRLSPGPSSPWRGDNPWLNSCRPRNRPTMFTPFGGAAGEFASFPHAPDCAHCARLLAPSEMRWGTGLCDSCYEVVEKMCKICRNLLDGPQLRWGSGLCNSCYDVCEKTCQFCENNLEFSQMHWRTGLCDNCYDDAEKQCQLCDTRLQYNQLHWASGLCDPCYDSCDKACRICHSKLPRGNLRWGTGLCDHCYDQSQKTCRICEVHLDKTQLRYQSGLCDGCYDKCEKSCTICKVKLGLSELHWRSGLCDECYDSCEKTCKKCEANLPAEQLHWGSGLCDSCYNSIDKICMLCRGKIQTGQLHWDSGICDSCYDTETKACSLCDTRLQLGHLRWGTGLCDFCYNGVEKSCRKCSIKLHFRSLRWGTGMCDACYNRCDKSCKKCDALLTLGNLRYGTGICDPCYDATERHCRKCDATMEFGQRRWATGICNQCYDKAKKAEKERKPGEEGLLPGVWAAIAAQCIFYMAPALLQPCLFLQISAHTEADTAPSMYAMVLTTASIAGMIAPVPLGLWAEDRGEREVYVGITIAAALAGVVISVINEPISFAIAWGVLNTPPAIRGVRAVLFSKFVPPEELSRAGQLASAAGLLGSVVGPIVSTLIQSFFHRNGFAVNSLLATASHVGCALFIMLKFPQEETPKRRDDACGCLCAWRKKKQVVPIRKTGSRSNAIKQPTYSEEDHICEECGNHLNVEEKRYRSALCNVCYDSYGGVGFKRFKWYILMSFCAVAGLLELSQNAAILGTFQPIAVRHFGWGSNEIAVVNFVSALLSVIVSLVSAQLRLPEAIQVSAAAALYCVGGLAFTCPPIQEWKCILGLVLGLKAQILFMAPFTSIFSRLIGRTRVTNRLTIALCLAPAIGGLVGTVLAPVFFRISNTWFFPTAMAPAIFAFVGVLFGVSRMDGSW